jgi:hypothetical protein
MTSMRNKLPLTQTLLMTVELSNEEGIVES